MGEYRRFIQNQFDKVKSTASDLISSRSEEKELVELEPHTFNELSEIADQQGISVQVLVNRIIDDHMVTASVQSVPITVDQKEENPLLYLDAICKFED
ncbi:hypothetical protein [Paenibacillus eucommiae]|uniref:Uncharacterized protein n=1 Tax=Paenibacillus eucommiae TaxID=1355755 RepID=A0ABS4J632_9BACL|nr:hypothetical protein [Paenibacillus eucommiae]MBP1995250.1 hypothetical protein [Paenibacillus eucommiae]